MKLFYKLSAFAWGAWWLLLVTVVPVESGPLNIEAPAREVTNNSLTDFDLPSVSKGCRYKTLFYNNGEEVSTDEPCLACQCKGTVVVCKLRICAETPVPPPPGCIVVHKAKSCCSHLVCHGQEATKKISREQRFPVNVSNETVMNSVSNETKDTGGYCVLDGTVYAEGSAMRSSTLCQYCFCIRGEMKCSSPQCVIPMNGCKPKFRSYACCPTNYDCGQSNETAILKTLPSSTQVPQFLKGCLVNNQFVPEGEPVLPVQLAGHSNASSQVNIICQTCFCMGGVVHCRPLECDQPIDGCEPIKEDGHCCPDRYDCTKAQQKHRLSTPTTPSAKKMFSTSISTSAALLASSASSVSSFPVSQQTTELPEEITTETVAASLSTDQALGDYVPVSITTTATLYDEVDSTTTGRPYHVDSFERIATIMADSSEENASIIPVRKAEPIKKARISIITTLGGFKNRSDLGSREERRSKDADELSPKQLQQSFEDDERDEYYNFPVFDTTLSNAIEDLGATTTFDDAISESTPDPELFDVSDTMASDPVETENPTTDNNIISAEHDETTVVSAQLTDSTQNEQFATSDVSPPLRERNDDLAAVLLSLFRETTAKVDEHTDAPTVTLPSSSSTSDISTTTASTSTSVNLEFIPFVEDDAYAPMDNDTTSSLENANSPSSFYLTDTIGQLSRHGFYQNKNISLLKPLELKFVNSTQEPSVTPGSSETEDALPILVEKDALPSTQFNIDNVSANLPPASSSLYNNGYYPHGSIIVDDGPADILHVAQGEVSKRKNGKFAEDDNIEKMNEAFHLGNENKEIYDNIDSNVAITTAAYEAPTQPTNKPGQPLKSIISTDKFIPSFAPPSPTAQINPDPVDDHPSRTYSKFGIQDAPLYRYDHGSLDNNAFAYKPPHTSSNTYHHRYYNEPEEIPTSRIQNPYNYYSTNNNPQTNNNDNKHRDSGIGMLPQLYKNNQFFYEDSSAALDSYEDYETYINPPANVISTPASVTHRIKSFTSSTPRSSTRATTFQFLGERVKLPSYNQQRATSTPRYKYAYLNSNRGTTSHRVTTERSTTAADYKPMVAPFPFNLPRVQDNRYNLGIKLSGCNVVGKMYSVGEVIDELSSECLKCMCSDIGVHCAERKC